MQALGKEPLRDVVGTFTEEAAVGAQLLALRTNECLSRFVLLLGPPERHNGPTELAADSDGDVGALEVRLLPGEVFVTMPQIGEATPVLQRAVRARFRPCSLGPAPTGCRAVCVPQESFWAAFRALGNYAALLPPSWHAAAEGGRTSQSGGPPWRLSYLPLPPCSDGVAV